MFSIDPTITDLKIRKRLYKTVFSINAHHIATPGKGNEEARFYLFILRHEGNLLAYIVLFIPETGRSIFYSYSENPFSESSLPAVEDDAREFAEGMGFFLDEKMFENLTSDEKDAWFSEQHMFMEAQPDEPVQAETGSPVPEPLTARVQPVLPAERRIPATDGKLSGLTAAQQAKLQQPTQAGPKASTAVSPQKPARTDSAIVKSEGRPGRSLRKEQETETTLPESGRVVHRGMEALARLMASF